MEPLPLDMKEIHGWLRGRRVLVAVVFVQLVGGIYLFMGLANYRRLALHYRDLIFKADPRCVDLIEMKDL